MSLVSTGIKSLDEVFGGGILRGSIVLLAGHPGVGKSTFAAQFLHHGAVVEGDPGIYVSFAESKNEFYYHMKNLGMDFERLESEGKFLFVDGLTVTTGEVLEGIIGIITEAIDKIDAKRIVLDPITAVVQYFKESDARAFFREALARLFKPLKITAYLVADLSFSREIIGFGFEEFLVDIVMRLQYIPSPGTELVRRRLVIQKSRYYPVTRYSYDFEITEKGIELFIPIEEISLGSYKLERVSTGISALDKMLGGGLLKSSLTLLSGPSGSGKTLLTLRYAVEGALDGKNSLYISFGESEEQLKNTLRSFGFDPNRQELRNHLHIRYSPPVFMTLREVMARVRTLVEAHKPERLVIDGVSALEKLYEPKELHVILKSIAVLCKKKGITVIYTSLNDILNGKKVGYSTIADTLIGLSFRERGGRLERVIAIVKMRGSTHDKRIRRIDFRKGEVVIGAARRKSQ